jgi:hypothetical protein
MLFTERRRAVCADCVSRDAGGGEEDGHCAAASGPPRQIVETLAERLRPVPMIFFIPLGYLPFARMRTQAEIPSASAGCGQFFFVRRDAYDASGGHEGFKASMHDGIRMPTAGAEGGVPVGPVPLHGAVRSVPPCTSGGARRGVGFAKNAYQGLGTPFLLVFVTAVRAFGRAAAARPVGGVGERAGTDAAACRVVRGDGGGACAVGEPIAP